LFKRLKTVFQGEEKRARAWLKSEIAKVQGYPALLLQQLLDCYLNKKPIHTMPVYREFLKRQQEKQIQKQAKESKKKQWVRFAKRKCFKAYGFTVALKTDNPRASVAVHENFEIQVSFRNQTRFLSCNEDTLEYWKSRIREAAAQKPEAQTLTVPLYKVDFDAYTVMREAGDFREGRIMPGPTVTVLLSAER
jgi:hypothetical protein